MHVSAPSIDTPVLIAKARDYVEASNRHDMARIGPMFAAGIVYDSSGVGAHQGADAVRTMMTAFHDANPEVHWKTSGYRPIGQDGVEFDFVMTLDGKEHPGVERIFFTSEGLIRRIEVAR